MGTLKTLANNFEKLSSIDLWFIVASNKRLKQRIIRLNTRDQLFKEGINADGYVIGYYSTNRPKQKKLLGTPYTLFDTGKFYESFDVIISNGSIQISAERDFSDGDIFEKYGLNIIGLTDENMEIVTDLVHDILANEIRKRIFQGL